MTDQKILTGLILRMLILTQMLLKAQKGKSIVWCDLMLNTTLLCKYTIISSKNHELYLVQI